MSAVDPARRARGRWHAPEKGSGPAFALSLLAHAVLFIAIAFMVRWKTEAPAPVSAELWTLPPAAVVQPTPPPRPVPVEIPPPPPPEPRKAEIVIEQKKVPPPKPEPKKEVQPEPKKEVKPEPKKEVKPEPKKADVKPAPVERPPDPNAAVQRALAQAKAGVVATGPSGVGLSQAYTAQIVGCIRPHIVFNVPDAVRPQQYVADFEVVLLPTGEQTGAPRLIKSSGLPAYDQAVERAIRRCDPFPPPKEGTMPRSVRLSFDPVEMR